MGQLSGKTAIITGAGSGIGKGIARALAHEGAHLILAGRTRETLEATAEALRLAGASPYVIPTDVADEAQVAASRHRLTSLRLELASGLVKIDLADAERKRPATGTEGDDFHAEHPCVEGDRRVKIGDGEHKMVKSVDLHR